MPNFVKIGSVTPEKELKLFRSLRPKNDDGQKKIAIGHMCDSGDLKTDQNCCQHI